MRERQEMRERAQGREIERREKERE